MLERYTLGICAIALLMLMIVGAADIVAGLVFGRYLAFKVDMSEVLLAVSVFLAWAVAQREDAHVRVDIFVTMAPAWFRRIGNVLTHLCGLLVFALLSYGAWQFASSSVAIMETSAATLGFPIWPGKVLCAAGALLTLMIIAYQFIREFIPRRRRRSA